ncbi:unnamed protein product [Mytilus coruscus]|uniref:Uncharacterized protein n=1 Tax=Mytilus coruscus TaxID=42192 RepID=A0A6J8DM85_MYTCO|nr:unnamed protein product [Mytilus coruscus]
MISSIIALFVLVPLVFSCCIPSQWEGIQGLAMGQIKDGKPSSIEALLNISFDATAKKMFVAGRITVDDKSYDEQVLQDYSKGKQYVVVSGQCIATAITDPFPQTCTSPSAKKLVTTYVGAGQDKLMVELYNDDIDGKKIDITVLQGSCIPVSAYQKLGESITFINYLGITAGISNATIFDIPKPCKNATIFPENTSHIRSTILFR